MTESETKVHEADPLRPPDGARDVDRAGRWPDWVTRNAQPVPRDYGKSVATDYVRACSALDAIPPEHADAPRVLSAWAHEFDRAGRAYAQAWYARCPHALPFERAYVAKPDAGMPFVFVLAARLGWLDPLPAAVKSREARAKLRAKLEAKAAKLAERERRACERNEAKAAREAARAAKRSTTRRETA